MGDVKAMEKYGTWSIDYGYNNYESFSILYNGTLQLNNNLYTNNRYIDGGTYDLQFKDAHNTGVTLSQLVASSGGTSTPDSVYQTLEGTVSVTTPKLIGGNLYGDTLFLNSGGYITQIDTGKISILDLKVTGTPSPTTFMRGDSTWAVPAGGGADSSFQKVLLDPLQNYGTGTGLWFGDGDAGIYESADDNLSLATSGVQAINIEPNGVHIYKNVGIGTNAGVSYPLEVRGRVQLVNGLPGGISIGGDVNGSTRSASTRKLAGIGSPDWSNTKTVEWLNFDSQGSTYNAVSFGGRIGGSAYAASSLIFVTAPNLSTTGGYNRMTITGAGNVGIGTSTPSAALQVAGQIIAGSYTVTPSATPGFNFHNGNTQQISVTANITSWTVTNALPAGSYTIYFKQDATGGRTIANLTGATKTANSLSFNTTANADNIVNIIVKPDGTIYWSVVEHVL